MKVRKFQSCLQGACHLFLHLHPDHVQISVGSLARLFQFLHPDSHSRPSMSAFPPFSEVANTACTAAIFFFFLPFWCEVRQGEGDFEHFPFRTSLRVHPTLRCNVPSQKTLGGQKVRTALGPFSADVKSFRSSTHVSSRTDRASAFFPPAKKNGCCVGDKTHSTQARFCQTLVGQSTVLMATPMESGTTYFC